LPVVVELEVVHLVQVVVELEVQEI